MASIDWKINIDKTVIGRWILCNCANNCEKTLPSEVTQNEIDTEFYTNQ